MTVVECSADSDFQHEYFPFESNASDDSRGTDFKILF